MMKREPNVEKSLKTTDGTPTTLMGRFVHKDKDTGEYKFVNLYTIKENVAVTPVDRRNVEVLCPIEKHAYRLNMDLFINAAKKGGQSMIFPEEWWSYIKDGDEDVDLYNSHTDSFETTIESRKKDYLEIQAKKQLKDELNKIKEETTTQYTKKENKMSNFNDGTMTMLGDAVKQGAKQAAANQANDMLADLAVKAMVKAGVPEELFLDDTIKKVVKVAVPILFHLLATNQEDLIDSWTTDGAAEKIQEVCGLATTVNTQETIAPLLATALPAIKEMLQTVATSGFDSIMQTAEGSDMLSALSKTNKSKAAVEADADDPVQKTIGEKKKVPQAS